MSAVADLLAPHLEEAAAATAAALSFTTATAGNVVPVTDPTPALPDGDVRLVWAELAEGTDIDIVVALTTAAAERVLGAAGDDNLASALAPVVFATVTALGEPVGVQLELAGLDEVAVGTPWGPPATEAATAGLFEGTEQIGNVIFLFGPAAEGYDDAMIRGQGSVTGIDTGDDTITVAAFPDADVFEPEATQNPLAMLRGVELKVTAELGRTKLPVSQLLDLGAGSVVELDRVAGTPVDVLVNGTVIARGEVVVIDEEYGVRITDILGIEDT